MFAEDEALAALWALAQRERLARGEVVELPAGVRSGGGAPSSSTPSLPATESRCGCASAARSCARTARWTDGT
jgi:hypothetical protein